MVRPFYNMASLLAENRPSRPPAIGVNMKIVDRVFGWLLVLGAFGHAAGSWVAGRNNHQLLVWALSGSLAALLVSALNLLRVSRPGDRPLALVSFCGSLAWAMVAMGFGASIGNLLDPRALYHLVIALVLTAMSLRTYLAARKRRA